MLKHNQVQFVCIEPAHYGQRLDNFLFRHLKGLPRSRIYRLIRRGEVRINKKRSKPNTRLNKGDMVRIPPHEPMQHDIPPKPGSGLCELIERSVLHEDENLLIINKPAGIAVHGGSGIRLGLIEAIRQIKPQWQDTELVHRLDRDTSGCLVLCKNLNFLRDLQAQLKNTSVKKDYLALVFGQWPGDLHEVVAPLQKNILSSGERMVQVDRDGKKSVTRIVVQQRYQQATLIQATPKTGRTHQIRVHCQVSKHSIVGDTKYRAGHERSPNQLLHYKSLCLHAQRIAFKKPFSDQLIVVEAPLHEHLVKLLNSIKN
ncbi:MAG: RluA family pseudouridine synthase [Gammaproteobacteria bacterium]|nr:RluA family pseudouridine synthase [Gammaproteobacteria bacterium]